uniref:Uncharacterized protein n=1 Tax=Setaria italica TaxID=4555 RepID=K3Z016_SETIT
MEPITLLMDSFSLQLKNLVRRQNIAVSRFGPPKRDPRADPHHALARRAAGSLAISPDGSISAELSHPSRPRPLVLLLSILPLHALHLQIPNVLLAPPGRRAAWPDGARRRSSAGSPRGGGTAGTKRVRDHARLLEQGCAGRPLCASLPPAASA